MKRYQVNFLNGDYIQFKTNDISKWIAENYDRNMIHMFPIRTKLNVSEPTHFMECWKHKNIEWANDGACSIEYLQRCLDDSKVMGFKTVAILYIQEKQSLIDTYLNDIL